MGTSAVWYGSSRVSKTQQREREAWVNFTQRQIDSAKSYIFAFELAWRKLHHHGRGPSCFGKDPPSHGLPVTLLLPVPLAN
eukprot:scaffold742_cov165-Amphora_coffeaeformis.AAC.5